MVARQLCTGHSRLYIRASRCAKGNGSLVSLPEHAGCDTTDRSHDYLKTLCYRHIHGQAFAVVTRGNGAFVPNAVHCRQKRIHVRTNCGWHLPPFAYLVRHGNRAMRQNSRAPAAADPPAHGTKTQDRGQRAHRISDDCDKRQRLCRPDSAERWTANHRSPPMRPVYSGPGREDNVSACSNERERFHSNTNHPD